MARCYGPKTGNSNLRKHLLAKHEALYRDAAKTHKWKHKFLDAQARPVNQEGSSERALPEYSYDVFIQFLVRFIVADDQVSRCLTLILS